VSGNLQGSQLRKARFDERFDELRQELEAEGGELSALELVLLDLAVMMTCRRAKDPADQVKLANAAARLLGTLRRRTKVKAYVPLRERFTMEQG
jgi:hypothetical protein